MKKLGKTGDFPEGKISEDDEGGLKMAVGIDGTNSLVVIDFGTPVTWLSMGPDEALELAKKIEEDAVRLKTSEAKGN